MSWQAHEADGERLMLRITINDQPPTTSFVLEGKLVGPWVQELEKCWASASAAAPARAMLVNLAAVTFIDSDGRALLARMRRRGVRLLSHGVLIDAIVAQIEAEEEQTQQNATSSTESEQGAQPCAKSSASAL
jgi:anti-anti-sigma regulatory factor